MKENTALIVVSFGRRGVGKGSGRGSLGGGREGGEIEERGGDRAVLFQGNYVIVRKKGSGQGKKGGFVNHETGTNS